MRMPITFATSLIAVIAGCRPASPPPRCATCAVARLSNQWCEACRVGYVVGVRIESRLLFDGMDAHGHTVEIDKVECPACQAAMKSDSFCDACRIGWVSTQAYFSRLTYHLGKGRSMDVPRMTCAACRKNAEKYGWCDACGVGMVGYVALKARSDFDGACRGYDLMLAAIDTSRRCDRCAIAQITDTECPNCRITYKDGQAVATQPAVTSAKRPAI